jgi:hypothetical protein
MRRIIERVVTVVTTTTWTISWQGDPLQPDPQTGSVADEFPKPLPHETAKHIQKFSSVIITKEADPPETKIETNSTADEPPQNSKSSQSKIERK